jgi:hypothetical protein
MHQACLAYQCNNAKFIAIPPHIDSHAHDLRVLKPPGQTTCEFSFATKSRASLSQPGERSLAISVDRSYSREVNIERAWGTFRESQLLRGGSLQPASQSEGQPVIVTSYGKDQHDIFAANFPVKKLNWGFRPRAIETSAYLGW